MKNSNDKVLKTKLCMKCNNKITLAFRIRWAVGKNWIFVCKNCCQEASSLLGYQYGGTWKSKKTE